MLIKNTNDQKIQELHQVNFCINIYMLLRSLLQLHPIKSNKTINLPNISSMQKLTRWTATHACLLSWNYSPLANLREWCHLRDICTWMQAPIKMKGTGSTGENTEVLHHIPGRDQHLCQQAKEPTKAQVFRQAWEQLLKPLVCLTHHLLSGGVGVSNSHLFPCAEKHRRHQKPWEIYCLGNKYSNLQWRWRRRWWQRRQQRGWQQWQWRWQWQQWQQLPWYCCPSND